MFPASAIKVNINKVTDNERVIVVERWFYE
jgi:hypothetical protein